MLTNSIWLSARVMENIWRLPYAISLSDKQTLFLASIGRNVGFP